MLEYDDTAFYYFALTFLVIYAVPGTYYALSELFIAFVWGPDKDAKARTTAEGNKSLKIKQQLYGFARINNTKFWMNLGITLVGWLLITAIVLVVLRDGAVQSFNPHDILGITEGATVAQIKKAYRTLSLKYHPDKNPGDQDAADTFMRIAKAYQALVDPVARENFEKYGNPDGKQSLEVSIGLPVLLLDNPKVVLVLYLCGMIIFIPAAVGLWYANSQQYGDKDIKYETYTMLYQMITPDVNTAKAVPELLASSAEFRGIVEECMPGTTANFKPPPPPPDAAKMTPQQQQQYMMAAQQKMAQSNPYKADDIAISKLLGSKLNRVMQRPRFEHPIIMRTNVLLHAHILRLTADLSHNVVRMLDKLLVKAPALLAGIIEIALNRRWLNSAVASIELQRHLVQAVAWPGAGGMYNDLPPTSIPLLQLPHFTDKEVRVVIGLLRTPATNAAAAAAGTDLTTEGSSTTSGTGYKVKTLADFLCLPDAEKVRGLHHLSEAQHKDIIAAARVMPRTRVETMLFVEEEEGDAENFYLANMDPETKVKMEQRRSRGDAADDEDENTADVGDAQDGKRKRKGKGKKGKKPTKPSMATLSSPAVLAARGGQSAQSPTVKKLKEHEVRGGDIYEGDLVTLRVIITRPGGDDAGNAAIAATALTGTGSGGEAASSKDTQSGRNDASKALEKEQLPAVHAPLFPGVVRENMWVILSEPPFPDATQHNRGAVTRNQKAEVPIHAMEKLTSQARVVVKEVRFGAPPTAGTYTLQLRVMSDAYMGMDYSQDVRFTVLSAAVLPVHTPHKEDVLLDKEPTVFEQLLGQTAGDSDSDSDSDDDDDDDDEEEEEQEGQTKAGADNSNSKESSSGTTAGTSTARATAAAAAGAAAVGRSRKMVVVAEDDGSDVE